MTAEVSIAGVVSRKCQNQNAATAASTSPRPATIARVIPKAPQYVRDRTVICGITQRGGTSKAGLFIREALADRLQFPQPFGTGRRIAHVKPFQRVEDDLGDDQPGIGLVVGGNDIPGRMLAAGGRQALLIGLHIVLPVFALLHIAGAELPVLVRLVDAGQEALALFFLG